MGAGRQGRERDRTADALPYGPRLPGPSSRGGRRDWCGPLSLPEPPQLGALALAPLQIRPAGGAPGAGQKRNRNRPGTLASGGRHVQLGDRRPGCPARRRSADGGGRQTAAALRQPQFLHQYGGRQGRHADRRHRPDCGDDHRLRHRRDFDDYGRPAAGRRESRCGDLRGG